MLPAPPTWCFNICPALLCWTHFAPDDSIFCPSPKSPCLDLLPSFIHHPPEEESFSLDTLFKYEPTNPESTHLTTSIIELSHSGPLYIYPNDPRARFQETEDTRMLQSSLKLFTLANQKSVYPASPFLPAETTIQALTHNSLLLLPNDWPWCFPVCPHCVTCTSSLGVCEHNKLSFWGAALGLHAACGLSPVAEHGL